MPTPDDGDAVAGMVLAVAGELDFSGEDGDHLEVPHDERLELNQGTIALSFTADDISGRHALFSKDYSGNRDGGDLTAFVRDGRIEVRFQSANSEIWLKTNVGSIQQGQDYHLAFSFGDDGARLYLDGVLAASNAGFTDGLANNDRSWAIGANTWGRSASQPNRTWDTFHGQIEDFQVFDRQFDDLGIAALADQDLLGDEQPPTGVELVGGSGVLGTLSRALAEALGI